MEDKTANCFELRVDLTAFKCAMKAIMDIQFCSKERLKGRAINTHLSFLIFCAVKFNYFPKFTPVRQCSTFCSIKRVHIETFTHSTGIFVEEVQSFSFPYSKFYFLCKYKSHEQSNQDDFGGHGLCDSLSIGSRTTMSPWRNGLRTWSFVYSKTGKKRTALANFNLRQKLKVRKKTLFS